MKSTKELARELGIIRKRTLNKSSAAEEDRKRAKKSCQVFSYLIILDFESTCWQGEKNRAQEIIEFPAVLMNMETGVVESEFRRYVQPQDYPILSEFCKQLTGITQAQVDDANPLFICLRQFSNWLKELNTTKMLIFGSAAGTGKLTAFVTWSDWDLGVCLHYECRRKQLQKPVELCSWIDLRATYRRHYQRTPKGLNGAMQELGINFEGREHSGLDDARNTACLAWKMICDGCVMKITKTQTESVAGRPSSLRPIDNSSVKMISKIQSDKLKTLSPQGTELREIDNQKENEPTTSLHVGQSLCGHVPKVSSSKNLDDKENIDWGSDEIDDDILKYVCFNSPSRGKAVLQSPTNSSSKSGSTSSTKLKITSDVQVLKVDGQRARVLQNITNSPVDKRKVETGATRSMCSPENFRSSNAFALGISKNSTPKSTATEAVSSDNDLGRKGPNIAGIEVNKSISDASTDGFSVGGNTGPTNIRKSSIGLKHSIISPSTTGTSMSMFRTPVANMMSPVVPMSSSMRKTPPMCECGCRAKRKSVQSPGPNFGKSFFCCGGQQRSSRPGCKFFRWETSPSSSGNSRVTSSGRIVSPFASPLQQPQFDTPSGVSRHATRTRFGTSIGPRNACK